MKTYTYSDARKHFAAVLDMSLKEKVVITRKNGSAFQVVPVTKTKNSSPLDVKGIDADITTAEIVQTIREGRSGR